MALEDIDKKVTDLAKTALGKNEGWLAVVTLLLWGLWLSWQLTRATKKIQDELVFASNRKLNALEAEYDAKIYGHQAAVLLAAEDVKAAESLYAVVQTSVDERLVAAEVVKKRISELKNWEALDALSKGL